jgi:hypothetical protein
MRNLENPNEMTYSVGAKITEMVSKLGLRKNNVNYSKTYIPET